VGVADPVDGLPDAGEHRGLHGAVTGAGALVRRRDADRLAPADRPAQPSGGWFALLRYRFPSSYRC
jgi:hypothetical protein